MPHIWRAVRVIGLALLGLIFAATGGHAQTNIGMPMLPPLPATMKQYYRDNPAAWDQFVAQLPRVQAAPPVAFPPPAGEPPAGTWTTVTPAPGNAALSNPLVLTDGSVIAHVSCTDTWFKLTPSNSGNYVSGTWSKLPPMPTGHTPRFFASAVLPDGRVIIAGGEYNGASCARQDSTKISIYDPVANAWAAVAPPSSFQTIGDAQTIVRADGIFMLSSCCDFPVNAALLNPVSLAWSATGTNKADAYNEENWVLLPSGKILTVDAYVPFGIPPPTCGTGSEIYDPATGAWSAGPSTVVQLADCSGNRSFETGPHLLRPDGTVVAFGGTTTGPAHTSIYNSGANTWTPGLDIPSLGAVPYTQAETARRRCCRTARS